VYQPLLLFFFHCAFAPEQRVWLPLFVVSSSYLILFLFFCVAHISTLFPCLYRFLLIAISPFVTRKDSRRRVFFVPREPLFFFKKSIFLPFSAGSPFFYTANLTFFFRLHFLAPGRADVGGFGHTLDGLPFNEIFSESSSAFLLSLMSSFLLFFLSLS